MRITNGSITNTPRMFLRLGLVDLLCFLFDCFSCPIFYVARRWSTIAWLVRYRCRHLPCLVVVMMFSGPLEESISELLGVLLSDGCFCSLWDEHSKRTKIHSYILEIISLLGACFTIGGERQTIINLCFITCPSTREKSLSKILFFEIIYVIWFKIPLLLTIFLLLFIILLLTFH